MRGYGRDYEHRNWLDRAGETVRGWFGGGRDYDRDYGGNGWQGWDGGDVRSMHRDWDRTGYRGRPGYNSDWGPETDWHDMASGGYRMNNWNNQHATRATVENHLGGYYGADYTDRERGGGMRHSRMGSDYGRDYNNQGWNRGNRGMMGRGGMNRGGMNRGGWGGNTRDAWFGNEYGGGGYNAGNDWGDYNRNGAGGDRFRNASSGGVEPGRYYDGYGIGSTGGNGYEPY